MIYIRLCTLIIRTGEIFMKRSKEDAEVTRQQLLKTALHIFGEKGFTATRLEDIAEAARVTRGAIYHHFENKKELFVALFKERIDPFFDIITKALAENLSPLERIRKMLLIVFENIENDNDFYANQQLDLMDINIKKEIKELKDYLKTRAETIYKIIIQLIRSSKECGEIQKETNETAIACTIFASITGFRFLISKKEDGIFPEVKKEAIVDILIKGIKA